MAATSPARAALLEREQAVLVVVDVQEAYRAALHEWDRVARAVATLVRGATVLGLPVIATEQYPKGLGHTAAEVAAAWPADLVPIEKLTLSCWANPTFRARLEQLGRRQVLVAGIEAHACMNQTVHELVAAGYEVHVPKDTTSSRKADDYAIGWEKMLRAGATPTSVETALLELVRTAEAPEFKVLQKLIR